MIFAFGIIACGVLELGTGLIWIALAHEITDSLWFHFGAAPLFTVISLLLFTSATGLTVWWNKFKVIHHASS